MAKTRTLPFDSTEHLRNAEAIAAHLADAIESGSPAEFMDALDVVVSARGVSEVAEASGLTRENLHNALRAGESPGFYAIQRVLSALGVQFVIKVASDSAGDSQAQ